MEAEQLLEEIYGSLVFLMCGFVCVTNICTEDADEQFISLISASLVVEYNSPASFFWVKLLLDY